MEKPQRDHVVPGPCNTCSAVGATLRCSRCQCVRYCSVECQREDWMQGHKRTCQKVNDVVESQWLGEFLQLLVDGANLSTDVFIKWWNRHNGSDWIVTTRYKTMTLLHITILKGAPIEVVLAVLNAWPGALKIQCTDGGFPFNCCLKTCSATSAAVSLAILEAWPDVAKEISATGQTALTQALWWPTHPTPEAVLLAIIAAWPGAASEEESFGIFEHCYPLHTALIATRQIPEAATLAILKCWPDAANSTEKYEEEERRRPVLFFALAQKATLAVVRALIAAWPGALHETSAGCTPLSFSVLSGCPNTVILAVLGAYPDAAKHKRFIKVDTDGATVNATETALATAMKAQRCERAELLGISNDVMLALLDCWPDAAKEVSCEAETLLHSAVNHPFQQEREEVTLAILAAWPSAAQVSGYKFGSPLLLALCNNAPEKVVLAVLAAYPDAVKIEDGTCGTLLNYATLYADNKVPDAVLIAMITACPDAAKVLSREVHNEGSSLLATYIVANSDEDGVLSEAVVLALINAWPLGVQQLDSTDETPLTWAFRLCVPENLILAMLEACPSAVMVQHTGDLEPTSHGQEPMNTPGASTLQRIMRESSMNTFSRRNMRQRGRWTSDDNDDTVLLATIRACPQVGLVTDFKGRTPLYEAVRCCTPEESPVVLGLLAACPDACMISNNNNNFPLICALENGEIGSDVIVALLSAWPESVFTTSEYGETALELALKNSNLSEHALSAVIDAFPGAVRIKNRRGSSALHTAVCHTRWSAAVLLQILKLWPEAIKEIPDSSMQGCFGFPPAMKFEGGTLLHTLASYNPRKDTDPDCEVYRQLETRYASTKMVNEVFFALVAAGISMTEVNSKKQTAAELASALQYNPQLVANFHEVAMFNKLPSMINSRHLVYWTTISHAWCTPSAKLAALTVLLVAAACHKRQVAPKMPPEIWSHILSFVRRYELRQGTCATLDEVEIGLQKKKYLDIVRNDNRLYE